MKVMAIDYGDARKTTRKRPWGKTGLLMCFVACLLCVPGLGAAAEGAETSAAPAVDAYIPCYPISKEQWGWSDVLLPVEPILEGAGIDLDLGELMSENTLQWKGNPYTLILVDESDLVDDPLPPVQLLSDGRYRSSILSWETPIQGERSVADARSITMPELEMSGYCGSPELGPYVTDAFVREGVLYYPHFTLELLLNDFGLHGEWLEDSSCFHIWSYTKDDYDASDWAVPEIMYSMDKGLTRFPTSEGKGFSYASPIPRGPFWMLVQNTYRHVYGRDLPEEQGARLGEYGSDPAAFITREEAVFVLEQVFSVAPNSERGGLENAFLDGDDFSSEVYLHSAEALFDSGILKGAWGDGGYRALPQSPLTREQAVSLCGRIFQRWKEG